MSWEPSLEKGSATSPGFLGFPGGADGKEPTCNAEDPGSIPGWERSPEEGMATHSSILAWRIPWTEESGGLQSMGPHPSEATSHSCFTSYPQTLVTINLLSISMDLPVLDISRKWDHKMWHLLTDFCYLTQHFQCPAILQPALVFHSFQC